MKPPTKRNPKSGIYTLYCIAALLMIAGVALIDQAFQ